MPVSAQYPETLYHYCSNEAFSAIINSSAFRLSDMQVSNDYREGELLLDVLHEAMVEVGGFSNQALRTIDWWQGFKIYGTVIAFCMSANSDDDLSQWWGYGDQGKGVSIGIDFGELRSWAEIQDPPIGLTPIEYDSNVQLELTKSALRDPDIVAALNDPSSDVRQAGKIKWMNFGMDNRFKWKALGFSNENEWRLMRGFETYSPVVQEGAMLHAKGASIAVNRDYRFSESKHSMFKSVTLGPKNRTPPRTLEKVLEALGYGDVDCKTSTISLV